MAYNTMGNNKREEESDQSDSEYTRLSNETEDIDQRTVQEMKGWDLFREIPVKQETGSMVTKKWVDFIIKTLKLLAYALVFAVVLGSAVISKGTLLFITSQLKKGRKMVHCNRLLALDQQFITISSLEERVAWLWVVLIVFGVPELGTFVRSVRICFFKTVFKPSFGQFFAATLIETLHTIGMATLLLIVLPELDVVKGAMIMNSMCIIPAILNAASRDPNDQYYIFKLMLDVLSASAQATAFIVWPILYDGRPILWFIPLACVFVSLGWWENYICYIDKESSAPIKWLNELRTNLKKTRYYSHRIISLWKIIVFMACILIALIEQDDNPFSFFTLASDSFNASREYLVHEVQVQYENDIYADFITTGNTIPLPISWTAPLWVCLIQVLSCYVCYTSAKFACKILIQNFSFTFALNIVVPVTVNGLIIFCGIKNADPCAFHGTIPDYLFFDIPPVYFLSQFFGNQASWVWLLWLASQAWVVVHVWKPRCERLAATDKLFAKPWYSGPVVDQSLLLNRSRDDDVGVTLEELTKIQDGGIDYVDSYEKMATDIKPTDSISRIYICATMWHETKEEIMEFMKSIFRLDEDQSARRVAQKYLGIVDPDYYELETHIFMDDAFEVSDHSAEDSQVNRFVRCLIDTIDEAASEVHLTNLRLRPPKKYPAPYGGRLVWTLPGKTKMICHLKDKSKIRHRKRWSQVMYMYYFLGHRLMDLPISVDRKETIAENTYLLALDGDIDFKPAAVTLLIDLMKKNKNLGAACGRIHPVGSGFMAWYQIFEYAIGHWLQKATEHMLGCVLCSPGCFSLFRGKALMDDNVMKKYTLTSNEARHYVQYDQGEDRWLCTLLLQRGYRVEYSAASDAYTHCPEKFDEFYNQRRRWVPSTMANIFDLLSDWKRTVKINDNISTLYIAYQIFLMGGTILGPGTIFLMLVGAVNAIAGISMFNSLLLNLIPIAIFLTVCMTTKSETQLFVASVITCLYAMLMMVVIVGIVLQIVEDGWLAPSSIFTVVTFSIFFITAALHPQEINCLFYLIIYYITIPSMYMLLIIYSLCNLNNVSWGTREVAQKKTAKDMENEKIEIEEAKKNMENQTLLRKCNNASETSGSIDFGISGLFRCVCCTNPKDSKEDLHLLQIATAIEKIEKKLHTLGASEEHADFSSNRRRSSVALRMDSTLLSSVPEDSENEEFTDMPREERDDLINPFWIEDPNLQKGEVDFLTTAESDFWKGLLDKYLRPLDENKEEQERIQMELKDLRDKMVFAFVMLNALFILVVFLLQLNQDLLHITWPLGQEVQISYDNGMIIIHQEYLTLEPIGLLFLMLFGTIMLIQFTAMLFHRLGTLAHLLSTIPFNWYCFKKASDYTDQALIDKHAIEIVKDLQKLNSGDLDVEGIGPGQDVGNRRTLHNLEKARESKHNIGNLDNNFKRRLTMLTDNEQTRKLTEIMSFGNSEGGRRATLRALQNRRDSIMADQRRSQLMTGASQGAVFLYETPKTTINDLSGRPSTTYINQGYAPAEDSDEDIVTPRLPRKSGLVRFQDSYT